MKVHGNTKHGMAVKDKSVYSRHSSYLAWVNMRQRCHNANGRDYKFYGGRGISIDPDWSSFAGFYADMGDPPKGYTLDRVDNDGDYTPENCRWATRKEQANNRNYNRTVTYGGKTQSVGKWAKEIDLPITTKNLHKRIFLSGWDVERAFTQPLKGK